LWHQPIKISQDVTDIFDKLIPISTNYKYNKKYQAGLLAAMAAFLFGGVAICMSMY